MGNRATLADIVAAVERVHDALERITELVLQAEAAQGDTKPRQTPPHIIVGPHGQQVRVVDGGK